MNKIYPGQVYVLSRLGKNQTPEPEKQPNPQDLAEREVSAKQALSKIPEPEFMTLEPREHYRAHKKEISFSKLSDWDDKQIYRQSPVLSMSNPKRPEKTVMMSLSSKADHRAGVKTIVEIIPHSAQSRRSQRYTNPAIFPRKSVQVNTNVIVSDDMARDRIHQITNTDLDNLIKEVMQSREDPYARIPAVNMSKNFTTSSHWKNRTISSSQGRRDRTMGTSMTIDPKPSRQRDQPRTPGSFGCSFPLRRHRRSKSNRCNHGHEQGAQNYLRALDEIVNINQMKRVLLKYNNSGLYKQKMRVPSANSSAHHPKRSLEKKQSDAAALGVVGVVGCRITPLP